MSSSFFSRIGRAFADAGYATGMGFKGAWRPAVLWRSAVIALIAGSVALWLFVRHWEVAQWFVLAFVPLLLVSFGLTGLQDSHARFSAPATTAGGIDLTGGAMDLLHGLSGLAHAAAALALAVACGLLLCGLLLTLLLSSRWLWPAVMRRARDRQAELASAAPPVDGGAWRMLRRVLLALVMSQLIYLAAMFVPHLGLLWFPLLAYLPVAWIAERALRGVASRVECEAVLRRERGAFALFGLVALASACVPVLNLLTPAWLAIGAARLSLRALAEVRAEAAIHAPATSAHLSVPGSP